MTAPNTVKYSEFFVEIEDPTAVGTYIKPCGITSRSFKRTFNTSESNVPDCDDEDLPMEIQRGVLSADWSIDGSFTVDSDDFKTWEDCLGVEINIRISRPKGNGESGHGTFMGYTAAAIITNFEQTGEYGSKAITGNVTITGAGKLTAAAYTPAP